MHECLQYQKLTGNKVRCILCPHQCLIIPGDRGKCSVRKNENGILYTENYGNLTAVSFDPIEKKPLYHFYPSSEVLSLGSYGCTMHCSFCQNDSISQCNEGYKGRLSQYSTSELRNILANKKCNILAYTYNEPVVFYEYMLDLAAILAKAGINSVMVSNGFIQEKALDELMPQISAFNIDIKSYENEFYRKYTGATLSPVLRTTEKIVNAGRHLEITYLLIPGVNDNPDKFDLFMSKLSSSLDENIPIHISKYFPRYKMHIAPTSSDSLARTLEIARKHFKFVYPGNTGTEFDSSTYCPECGKLLISRSGYNTRVSGLRGNKCAYCNCNIYGIYQSHD